MKTAPNPTRDEGYGAAVKVGARGATQAGFDANLDTAPQRPRINPEREAIFAARQVLKLGRVSFFSSFLFYCVMGSEQDAW
jgi:hypothetical protein